MGNPAKAEEAGKAGGDAFGNGGGRNPDVRSGKDSEKLSSPPEAGEAWGWGSFWLQGRVLSTSTASEPGAFGGQ